MADQSFSAENFRKIFDYENRKGLYLETSFFPRVEEITKKIKKVVDELRGDRGEQQNTETEIEEKQKRLDTLKMKKEDLLTKEFEKISAAVQNKGFSLGLKKIDVGLGKDVYTHNKSAMSYFVLKQLQYNIRKLYKVKQGNRHNIVCQLRDILSDDFPKYIIKTDIKSFYESIPVERLLPRINNDNLLTPMSKKVIKRIFHEYREILGQERGLPRGIGVSAYLAEYYMRQFDVFIKNSSNVIYYARYVDDIIIVYTLQGNQANEEKMSCIKKEIKKMRLALNFDKTEHFFVKYGKTCKSIEYLGYKFKSSGNELTLSLTESRREKYIKRIELSFKDYQATVTVNEKMARKILIKRIRFLTGNTRLVGNKKNVLVGIYFSNSLLTDICVLKALDIKLKQRIAELPCPELRKRLSESSFTNGFTQKKFHKFSPNDLKDIVGIWKHAT